MPFTTCDKRQSQQGPQESSTSPWQVGGSFANFRTSRQVYPAVLSQARGWRQWKPPADPWAALLWVMMFTDEGQATAAAGATALADKALAPQGAQLSELSPLAPALCGGSSDLAPLKVLCTCRQGEACRSNQLGLYVQSCWRHLRRSGKI